MAIQIFDLDGTLTYGIGDIENTTEYNTYAFWHILSFHFVKDPKRLQKLIEQWRIDVKKHSDLGTLAQKSMQQVVDDFAEHASAESLRAKAKVVTEDFIQHGVIRLPILERLQQSLAQGDTTIITSGSYVEAVEGFVEALIAADLLSEKLTESLHLIGATIDWQNMVLVHSNVHDHKVKGIEQALQMSAEDVSKNVQFVYGDDPWVNDAGIFSLATNGIGYVIDCELNRNKIIPNGLKKLKI